MSTEAEDHVWNQIDHELIGLERRLRQIGYRPDSVKFSDFTDILQKHVKAINETAEQTYCIYCEVWRWQKKPLSPEFFIVVHKRAIAPFLQHAPQAFERYLRDRDVNPFLSALKPWVRSLIADGFAHNLSSLLREVEMKWAIKLRAEALRAKYQQMADPAAANSGGLDNARVPSESTNRKARTRAKTRPITEAIQAIWKKYPECKSQQVAQELDVRAERNPQLQPRSQWPKWQGCPRLWVDARKERRGTVDSLFSRAKERKP